MRDANENQEKHRRVFHGLGVVTKIADGRFHRLKPAGFLGTLFSIPSQRQSQAEQEGHADSRESGPSHQAEVLRPDKHQAYAQQHEEHRAKHSYR